jgi:hypothetical protein
LIQRINTETDAKEKAKLEAQFKAECDLYDSINPDSMPMDISSVYADIVRAVAPIAHEAGIVVADEIAFPSDLTQGKWVEIHRQIVLCKRMAATWLSKSRKFAVDRWGIDFVTESEVQMELALGFEHKEIERAEPSIERVLPMLCHSACKWASVAAPMVNQWDREHAAQALEALRPVADVIEALRAVADTGPGPE